MRHRRGGLNFAALFVFSISASLIPQGGVLASGAIAPEDVVIEDAMSARALTEKPGDPEAGAKWFVDRKLGNCLACHVNSAMKTELFHGETGPALDGVASRYDEATLRAILIDSKQVFGDQTLMPAFYRTKGFNRTLDKFAGKTILEAQQVEDILAYLVTLVE